MTNIFLKYAMSQQPVLLYTDGQTSHLTIDAIDLWNYFLFFYHCVLHALQPLDIAVLKSLKDLYSKLYVA